MRPPENLQNVGTYHTNRNAILSRVIIQLAETANFRASVAVKILFCWKLNLLRIELWPGPY